MIDISEKIKAAAHSSMSVDERMREVFMRHYNCEAPKEGEELAADDPRREAGHMAWALDAVDVSVRLVNVFLAIKNPNENRTYRAICDLTYQLGTSEFWRKNANVLNPIVHVCLNTYRDGVDLLVERTQREEYSSYDALISASRAAPLEIFPVIAYLVGGPKLMVSASLPLKRDLAPYFLS